MRTRGLAVVSAVLATGMLTMGAGAAAAATLKPAARVKPAARTAAATARGPRKLPEMTKEAILPASPGARVNAGICSAPPAHKALAAQLSAGIQAALRGRAGNHAVTVYDAVTGVSSLGAFTGKGKNYPIAVLTDDNPSERYGIDTVENVARAVHRDLNAAGSALSARLAANVAPTPTASAATAQGQPSSWA